jgi:ATP-dependent RNA helicase MSS116
MGFAKELEIIQNQLLPKTERSTYMFSATLSKAIKSLATDSLNSNHKYIDTVPANEVSTHLRIKQSFIVSPFSLQAVTLDSVLNGHKETTANPKIIVFFSTTKLVSYMASIFNELPNTDILQIHSKMDQRQRSRVAERFRQSRSAILFTSDVSARGVDYPGVTLVVQMGVPTNTEQYIHRVGRTGRAGKTGEGILIISPYERNFVKQLSSVAKVPIKTEIRYDPQVASRDETAIQNLKLAYHRANKFQANECYLSFLGFCEFFTLFKMPVLLYINHFQCCDSFLILIDRQIATDLNISSSTLVIAANDFAIGFLGLEEAPRIPPRLAGNLGISRVPGVRIGFSSSGDADVGMEGEENGKGGSFKRNHRVAHHGSNNHHHHQQQQHQPRQQHQYHEKRFGGESRGFGKGFRRDDGFSKSREEPEWKRERSDRGGFSRSREEPEWKRERSDRGGFSRSREEPEWKRERSDRGGFSSLKKSWD